MPTHTMIVLLLEFSPQKSAANANSLVIVVIVSHTAMNSITSNIDRFGYSNQGGDKSNSNNNFVPLNVLTSYALNRTLETLLGSSTHAGYLANKLDANAADDAAVGPPAGISTSLNANPLFGDALALCVLTGLGVFGNALTIVCIVTRRSLRKVINMFLLHHCFINLTQCLLYIPFIMALLNDAQTLRGCEILGGTFVTMVTANVLNIAAMTACEAYRFEDFMQQQSAPDNKNWFLKNSPTHSQNRSTGGDAASSSNVGAATSTGGKRTPPAVATEMENGTASYTCVIFGFVMIWLSSIILHLGITLIGSDSKQFYNHAIRNCFFTIGDRQTYILYIMWILLTAVSLVLTIIYVRKIFKDISSRKKLSAKYFITAPVFYQQRYSLNYSSPNLKKDLATAVASGIDKAAPISKLKKSSSLSYSSLNVRQNSYGESSSGAGTGAPVAPPRRNVRFGTKHDRYYYYYSHSATDLSSSAGSYQPHRAAKQLYASLKPRSLRCRSFLFGAAQRPLHVSASACVAVDCAEPTAAAKPTGGFAGVPTRGTSALYAAAAAAATGKRRYDFVKQILQRIKIQFIVIKLFILCWIPLFVTIALDARFEVSVTVYRYLTLIAFANASLTPYCYLTILMPCINKYCLRCLRTDGKQSRKKSAFYNAMEKYYEKLGDRFHNLSARSSLSGASETGDDYDDDEIVRDHRAVSPPPPPLKETSLSSADFYAIARKRPPVPAPPPPLAPTWQPQLRPRVERVELKHLRSLSYDLPCSRYSKPPVLPRQSSQQTSYKTVSRFIQTPSQQRPVVGQLGSRQPFFEPCHLQPTWRPQHSTIQKQVPLRKMPNGHAVVELVSVDQSRALYEYI